MIAEVSQSKPSIEQLDKQVLYKLLHQGLNGNWKDRNRYLESRLTVKEELPERVRAWSRFALTKKDLHKIVESELGIERMRHLSIGLGFSHRFKSFLAQRFPEHSNSFLLSSLFIPKPVIGESWSDGIYTRPDGGRLTLREFERLADAFTNSKWEITTKNVEDELIEGLVHVEKITTRAWYVSFVPRANPTQFSLLYPWLAATIPRMITDKINATIISDFLDSHKIKISDLHFLELVKESNKKDVWQLNSYDSIKNLLELQSISEKRAKDLTFIGETPEAFLGRFCFDRDASIKANDFLDKRSALLVAEKEEEKERIRREEAAALLALTLPPPPTNEEKLRAEREIVRQKIELLFKNANPDIPEFELIDGTRVIQNAFLKGIATWKQIEDGISAGYSARELIDEIRLINKHERAPSAPKEGEAVIVDDRAHARFMEYCRKLEGTATADKIRVDVFEIDGEKPYEKFVRYIFNDDDQAVVKNHVARFSQGHLGDHKKIATSKHIWEHRIHLASGYRVYFAFTGDGGIVLLTGGTKRTQENDLLEAELLYEQWEIREKEKIR